MITSALHRAADWAKSVFSSAALGDPRRTTRLVNVAAQLAQQCQGRCGEVQAIATAATGLACFIFRFLRRPHEGVINDTIIVNGSPTFPEARCFHCIPL